MCSVKVSTTKYLHKSQGIIVNKFTIYTEQIFLIFLTVFVDRKKMYFTFNLFAEVFRMQEKNPLFYELFQMQYLCSRDTYILFMRLRVIFTYIMELILDAES